MFGKQSGDGCRGRERAGRVAGAGRDCEEHQMARILRCDRATCLHAAWREARELEMQRVQVNPECQPQPGDAKPNPARRV